MYIFVDLDKTFLKIDISRYLFKQNPMYFFKICFYSLFYSDVYIKKMIAEKIEINDLFFKKYVNHDVLNYLKKQDKSKIILITGSHQILANKIKQHFSFFAKAIGSEQINCIGVNKLNEILKITNDFLYIGDSTQDIPIWKKASKIGIVLHNTKISNLVHDIIKKYKKDIIKFIA